MITKKTKQINLRLSEQQFLDLKRKSEPFKTMSAYIFAALREFSDFTAKDDIESRKQLALLFRKFDEKLAHTGGNLNQAMRRINEAAIAGLPYHSIVTRDLMPLVKDTYALCNELRKELHETTSKLTKYK